MRRATVAWTIIGLGAVSLGILLVPRPSYQVKTAECPTFGQNRLDLVVGQSLPESLRTAQAGEILVTLPDCGGCDNGRHLLTIAASVFGAENVRVFHSLNPPQEKKTNEWRSVTDLGATEFRPMIVVVGPDKRVENA